MCLKLHPQADQSHIFFLKREFLVPHCDCNGTGGLVISFEVAGKFLPAVPVAVKLYQNGAAQIALEVSRPLKRPFGAG